MLASLLGGELPPTPFYFYDLSLLRRTLRAINSASARHCPGCEVHYAIKANANPLLLKEIAAAGLGIDAVSGGELRAAINAGFKASSIFFAGVGKTDDELRLALKEGVGCINVESLEEIKVIGQIAREAGIVARVALRVNPDIDAHTHHYITTGLAENKFGIDMSVLDSVVDMVNDSPWLSLTGLHFHIGSQITIMEPYVVLCRRINKLLADLGKRGLHIPNINVGGGLGIDYDDPDGHPVPDFEAYFSTFGRNLDLKEGQTLHFELGRAVVGQCGSLITRVLYVKEGLQKRFVIVDAGMTDLIRPALYGAVHRIENLDGGDRPVAVYDVVGPVCESTDVFAADYRLPLTRRGDLLAIRSAGAYGEAMSSTYNLRPLPGCVARQGN